MDIDGKDAVLGILVIAVVGLAGGKSKRTKK